MLLLDDDDELPTLPGEEELELSLQLGSETLLAIDAALVDHARAQWLKVARVVHDAIKARGFAFDDSVIDLHVRRVIQLVDANVLEAQGNLRRPRWSEVRTPASPANQ